MTDESPNWVQLYDQQEVETMPWFHPELDADLVCTLKELSINSGHFLDLGTGPATQAIELAKRGFQVTASDISPAAIRKGRERAQKNNAFVHFVVDNIVSTKLRGPFDWVFDRGCFHVLPIEKRALYVENVASLLIPKGVLFLKTFHVSEPGDWGPNRFSASEINKIFEKYFSVMSIKETVYQGTLPNLPKALFAILQRI